MRSCCQCGASFAPTGNGYRCPPCRKVYDQAWREKRKAEGKNPSGTKMPREYHSAYGEAYRQKPEVKERLRERARIRRSNPNERQKHEARWKLNRAVASGKIAKEPCEVCRSSKTEAHHDDYSRPLDVRWLCRQHHVEIHAKAEGRS